MIRSPSPTLGGRLGMDDEVEFAVSIPLDEDGFLRRECPFCEREFKWLSVGEEDSSPPEGFCCPYCGERAQDDQWFTRGQLRVIEASVEENIVAPQLRELRDSLSGLADSSGGLLQFEVDAERQESSRPRRLTEPNDMVRVDFDCHPDEPIKIVEDWHGAVHCLICGQPSLH